MDPTAINKTLNGQHLILMGQTTTSAMLVFIVILYSIKTTTIIGQAFTLPHVLGALHVLSHLSCTTSLWVRSYQFHFSKRRLSLVADSC